MAHAKQGSRTSMGGHILGLLNPIRDPSLLVGIILTVIWLGSSGDPPYEWVIFVLLNWIAVKAVIWLFVNFAFSFVYLSRKALWALRHPRLAWRLLDAMGTEEIIIGGLSPEMFVTEDGNMHEGQMAYAAMAAGGYPGIASMALGGPRAPYAADDARGYDPYSGYGDRPDAQMAELQEQSAALNRLLADWLAYTEEKWRAVSDSQLGWKPLRGRWNGWDDIYQDSFTPEGMRQADATYRRFDNAQGKGSAASAVACFLHDMETLRQNIAGAEDEQGDGGARLGGLNSSQPITQRTAKGSIIRSPRIVDANK